MKLLGISSQSSFFSAVCDCAKLRVNSHQISIFAMDLYKGVLRSKKIAITDTQCELGLTCINKLTADFT